MKSHESYSQPNPREALLHFLNGEGPGSPKWQRLADSCESTLATQQLNKLYSQAEKFRGQSATLPEFHIAVALASARMAAINETVRQRSVGPNATEYLQANVREVYNGYFPTWAVYDQTRPDYCLLAETDARIAEAVNTDLADIARNWPPQA